MTNPFDGQDDPYSVLINTEGQYSLWPTFADLPAGWTIAHGPAGRTECLEYVNANWTDMRPRGLAAHMDAQP